MRNIFIIAIIVLAFAYMISILVNKYETIKQTNKQIQMQKEVKPTN